MSYAMAGIGLGISGAQAIIGAAQKKKAEREKRDAEAKRPKFAGSSELDQLYQQEKMAAATPAQQTAQYKMGEQLSQRNLATGLGAASSAGTLGQGLVSKLVQGTNDASMRNLVTAQNLKEQRMGRLGGLVNQKAAEGLRKFQMNEMQPWEMKYSDAIAKGVAGAQTMQTGFQNMAGTINQLGAIQGSKDYLKQMKKLGLSTGTTVTGRGDGMNTSQTDPTGHFLI